MAASDPDPTWGGPFPGMPTLSEDSLLSPGQTVFTVAWTEEDASVEDVDAPPSVPSAGARYQVLDRIGRGGMGEVYRVRDTVLDREVALKVLHGVPASARVADFRREARLTARLQHPGIVPVHDLGLLPEGRLFFTMKEVRGHTFREAIRALHQGPAEGFVLGLRRLLSAFRRACEAIAYAHDAGVVHRDLKPHNLMIGTFGEVMVLDWGLGRLFAEDVGQGGVSGTPRYMAPEQARGEALGPEADVWSLGACLREILCGEAPFADVDRDEAIARARAGLVPPSEAVEGRPVDPVLLALCDDCLRASIALRPPDAGVLTEELAAWLDGANRRDRGLREVGVADEAFEAAARMRVGAETLAREARERLEALGPAAPIEERESAWDAEDRAKELRQRGKDEEARGEQHLRAALSHDPDLAEAHARIADRAFARHRALEADGAFEDARRLEPTLREHGRGRYDAYLRGVGALTLVTEPAGARATLHRFVPRRRRLEPVFERELGTTPLRAVPLEMGSYLVTLEVPGRPVVRYPVRIARGEHWDGVPPGETDPEPVPVPERLPDGEVYVPAGWFTRESELPWASFSIPRERVWCHGFFIQEHPVTVAEYAVYLDDLRASGDAEALEAAVPRYSTTPLVGWDPAEGRHVPLPDTEGTVHGLDWPMVGLTWGQSRAYGRWLGARSGVDWRLPFELEFEKAARGVDERSYPWGDEFESTFSRNKDNAQLPDDPGPIGVPEEDRSPSGVHGLAGNVAAWCLDAWPGGSGTRDHRVRQFVDDGAMDRIYRGGAWTLNGRYCQSRVRLRSPRTQGTYHIGIRLVRTCARCAHAVKKNE